MSTLMGGPPRQPMTGSTSALARTEEPTLGALIGSATKDLSGLVRGEIELAKVELKHDVKAAGVGGAMFAVAAFLGVLAVILLSIAAAYGLTEAGLDAWLAFLIIGALYVIAAGVLAVIGLRNVKKIKAPEQSIAAAKDTVGALKGKRPGTL